MRAEFGICVSLTVYLCVCVSAQTACALQFLNERNISHLDLKPQNILLSGSVLKLAGDPMPTCIVKQSCECIQTCM